MIINSNNLELPLPSSSTRIASLLVCPSNTTHASQQQPRHAFLAPAHPHIALTD